MREADRRPGREESEGAEAEEWSASGNPAMRAVLDHIAEELAREFVGLMRGSVIQGTDAEEEEERQ